MHIVYIQEKCVKYTKRIKYVYLETISKSFGKNKLYNIIILFFSLADLMAKMAKIEWQIRKFITLLEIFFCSIKL